METQLKTTNKKYVVDFHDHGYSMKAETLEKARKLGNDHEIPYTIWEVSKGIIKKVYK